jgi:hypothetical protein
VVRCELDAIVKGIKVATLKWPISTFKATRSIQNGLHNLASPSQSLNVKRLFRGVA